MSFESTTTTAALPTPNSEVAFGSLANNHNYFDAYVDFLANIGQKVKLLLYITSATTGVRALAAQSDWLVAGPTPVRAIAALKFTAGSLFELQAIADNVCGNIKCSLVGYEAQENFIPPDTSTATTALVTSTEVVMASIATPHSFFDASAEYIAIQNVRVRWSLYATAGTGGVRAKVAQFDAPVASQNNQKLYILQDVGPIGATLIELVAQALDPVGATPNVKASLDGFDPIKLIGPSNNVVIPEYFSGGVNKNAAENTLAFNNALSYLNSIGGGVLQLSVGTYLIGGPVLIPNNCEIRGQGNVVTTLQTSSNNSVLTINGENILIKDLRILGNIAAFAPGSLQYGINNSAHSKVFVNNVILESLGIGYFADSPGPEVYLGSNLEQVIAKTCSTGFLFSTNEYHTVIGCIARGCYDVGFDIASGNIEIVGGSATSNNVGVKVRASANDGHGIVSSMQINHNSQAIYIDTINNGFTFSDNHVYYGNIYIISSNGIQFIGGEYDLDNYYFDGSLGTRFDGISFPNANGNIIHDSYNGHPSTEYWNKCLLLNGDPFIGGYVSMNPIAGANVLTYQQSYADYLDLLPGTAAPFVLANKRTPTKSNQQTIKNNTGQDATIQFLSGASVIIATLTSAIISGDGVNLRKMLSGT